MFTDKVVQILDVISHPQFHGVMRIATKYKSKNRGAIKWQRHLLRYKYDANANHYKNIPALFVLHKASGFFLCI